MPIYSEVISNNEILRILGTKYQRVLLIGCGACMNESLAYKNHMPIFKNDSTIPYATAQELNRIIKVLKSNGYQTEEKIYEDIYGFYCMTDIAVNKYPLDWAITPDIILILSCGAGYLALRAKIPDTKIVKITKQVGYIAYSFYNKKNKRLILKKSQQ